MNTKLKVEDYKRFKKLLEYFVAHAELRAQDLKYDTIEKEHDNPKWKILTEGFEKSGNRTFSLSGQGHNNGQIQNQIKNWDYYKDEGRICISIDGTRKEGGYLLHWNIPSLKINIKADWVNIIGKDISGGSIEALRIVSNDKETGIIKTRDDLGLFDNKEPNDCLKDFFNSYIEQKNLYLKQNMTLTEKLVDKLKTVKNLILTGAPGTGKT